MSVQKWIDQQGLEVEYLPAADRAPKFFEHYPPERYSFHVQAEPFDLSILELAGKLDPELGKAMIREFTNYPKYRFTMSMTERETGREVVNRSAVRMVLDYKDYETGETAAFQRVMAALGFDSDSVLREERRDWVTQDWQRPTSDGPPTPRSVPSANADGGAEHNGADTPAPSDAPAPEAQPGHSRPRANRRSARTPDDQRVHGAMMRQIQHLAQQKGVTVTVPATRDEARKLLKELYHTSPQPNAS